MRFSVTISGDVAVIVAADTGRYASDIEAVMATLRAAHDIKLTAIVYGDITCGLIDNFTGGLRQNSVVVHDLLGVSIKDQGLLSRIKNWIVKWFSTYRAEQKHLELKGHKLRAPERLPGGSLSLSVRNRLHPIRMGKHV